MWRQRCLGPQRWSVQHLHFVARDTVALRGKGACSRSRSKVGTSVTQQPGLALPHFQLPGSSSLLPEPFLRLPNCCANTWPLIFSPIPTGVNYKPSSLHFHHLGNAPRCFAGDICLHYFLPCKFVQSSISHNRKSLSFRCWWLLPSQRAPGTCELSTPLMMTGGDWGSWPPEQEDLSALTLQVRAEVDLELGSLGSWTLLFHCSLFVPAECQLWPKDPISKGGGGSWGPGYLVSAPEHEVVWFPFKTA